MTNHPASFDASELTSYAAQVAERRSSTPQSTLTTRTEEAVTVRKWLRSQEEVRTTTTVDPAGGWMLLVDPDEGTVDFVGRGPQDAVTAGSEVGRLMLLTIGGALVCCRYSVSFRKPLLTEGFVAHTLTDRRAASAQDLADFDVLNRAEYEEIQGYHGSRPGWRRELGDRRSGQVTHPGTEVMRALRSFDEGSHYVSELTINY
jgi:hypothetical protein